MTQCRGDAFMYKFMYRRLMNQCELVTRVLRAAAIFKSQGFTQAKLAARLGASQSQISRILSGESVSRSKLAEELCLYAETLEVGVSLEAVMRNEELLQAVRQVWDGSAAHAKALATVIRSLSVLARSSVHKERP